MKTRWLIGALAAFLVWAPAAEAKGKLTPLIFVHGGAGSGAQFESQGLRFSSNGYPRRHINVFEYDSTTALANLDSIQARLDELVAQVKQRTGKSKVDILGHSLGTTIAHLPIRRGRRGVAHYVNIDGRTAARLQGDVATRALGRPRTGARDRRRDQRHHPQPDACWWRRRSSRSCRSTSSSPSGYRAGTSLRSGRSRSRAGRSCSREHGRGRSDPPDLGGEEIDWAAQA